MAPDERTRPDRDRYFMGIAMAVRTRANCRGNHVGAILVLDGHVVSTGYDGIASDMVNCEEGGCDRSRIGRSTGRVKATISASASMPSRTPCSRPPGSASGSRARSSTPPCVRASAALRNSCRPRSRLCFTCTTGSTRIPTFGTSTRSCSNGSRVGFENWRWRTPTKTGRWVEATAAGGKRPLDSGELIAVDLHRQNVASQQQIADDRHRRRLSQPGSVPVV